MMTSLQSESDSLTSKKSFGERAFLTIIVILSAFGSFLHIFSPTFSLLNIFAFTLTPLFLVKFCLANVTFRGAWYFSSLLLLLVFTAVVAVFEPSVMATREIRNVVAAIFFSSMAIHCLALSPVFAFRLARSVFLAISAVAILQVSYETFGVGLVPQLDERFRQYGLEGLQVGFPAVFGNPNDFSSFVLCYFLLLLVVFRVGLVRSRWIFLEMLLVAAMLFISGSRIAIILFVFGISFFSKLQPFRIIAASLVAGLWIGNEWLQIETVLSELYTISRFLIELDLIRSGQVGESLSLRAGSHIFFITNPLEFVVGSFSYEPICVQFLHLGGYTLLAYNPHSFIMGLFCVFGFLCVPILFALSMSLLPNLASFLRQPLFSVYIYVVLFGVTSISSWFLATVQCVFFLVLAFSIWLEK